MFLTVQVFPSACPFIQILLSLTGNSYSLGRSITYLFQPSAFNLIVGPLGQSLLSYFSTSATYVNPFIIGLEIL